MVVNLFVPSMDGLMEPAGDLKKSKHSGHLIFNANLLMLRFQCNETEVKFSMQINLKVTKLTKHLIFSLQINLKINQ